MFDQYIVDADTVRNIGPAAAPTGFSFESKLGYYRGLGLSMVEDLAITLDGQPVARDAIYFDDGHGALSLEAMETEYDRRWNFGAPAVISVAYPGGLPPGDHKLSLRQVLRVSYMPFPSVRYIEKVVSVS